jgi:DNA-binding NarL/FixJ family response regulator
MIRVLLADDHHLVRKGIRALLEKTEDIEVVGEAMDGEQAIEMTERLAPDVLVIDIGMPRLNGIQAIERVHALGVDTRAIVLSMHSDETLVRQALRNGAKGYLLKRSVTEELLLAVRAASQGETYLSPGISEILLGDYLTLQSGAQGPSAFDQLTPREREVLQLIAEGHTNMSIAQALDVSVKTVEKHRANLMNKLDTHEVAGLTRIALKHGLIFLDE